MRKTSDAGLVNQVLSRLRQPSTYAGAALILGYLGWNVDPGVVQEAAKVGMFLGGAAAVLLNEGGRK